MEGATHHVRRRSRSVGLVSLEPDNAPLKAQLREALSGPRRAVCYIVIPALTVSTALAAGLDAVGENEVCNIGAKVAALVVPLVLSVLALLATTLRDSGFASGGTATVDSASVSSAGAGGGEPCGACGSLLRQLTPRVVSRALYMVQSALLLMVMYVELSASAQAADPAAATRALAGGFDGDTGARLLAVASSSSLEAKEAKGGLAASFDLSYMLTFLLCQYTVGLLALVPLLDVTVVHLAAAPYFYMSGEVMVKEWKSGVTGWETRGMQAGVLMCTWLVVEWFLLCCIMRAAASWVTDLLRGSSKRGLAAAGGARGAHADADAARYDVLISGEEVRREYVAQTLHDIGTPLATFSLGLDLLFSSPLVVSNDYRDVLETMKTARDMMTLTRKKAMDYFRHQAGIALVPNIASTDVHDLVLEKCRRIMTGYTGASQVPFHFFIDNRVSRFVLTDRDWVWECAINYLSNAQKVTKEGSIHMSVILVTAPVPGQAPQHLRVEVRDTGPGVPDDKRANLFKPFSQLQKGGGGTGLGLYSVKKKVQVLGGTVGVEHNPEGRGSVFFFTIPYRPDTQLNFGGMYYQRDQMGVLPSHLAITPPWQHQEGRGATTSCSPDEGRNAVGQHQAFDQHQQAVRGLLPGSSLATISSECAGNSVDSGRDVVPSIHVGAGVPDANGGGYTEEQTVCHKHLLPLHTGPGGPDRGAHGQPPGHSHGAHSHPHALQRGSTTSLHLGEAELEAMVVQRAQSDRGAAMRHVGEVGAGAKAGERRRRSGSGGRQPAPNQSAGGSGADLEAAGAAGRLNPDASTSDSHLVLHHGAGQQRHSGQPHYSAGSSAGASGGRRRSGAPPVLVVEDDATMSKFLAVMLNRQGYQVQLAGNGMEGLTAMREKQFLAVLTDTHMPVMGGYEQVQLLREWEASLAQDPPRRQFIISMSADAQDSAIEAARWGCDAYLPKPVDMSALSGLLRTLAERGDAQLKLQHQQNQPASSKA